MIIQKEDLLPFVLHPTVSDDIDTTGYTGGDAIKSLAGSKKDGKLLLIHLYNGEFEVVTPSMR